MNHLLEVRQFGQSVWLDYLSRDLIADGTLRRLIEDEGLGGVTTNPAIFYKAIKDGVRYRDDLERLKAGDLPVEQRYEALVIPDIQAACDLFLPCYRRSQGEEGYVSLEVSPHLAHDEENTVAAVQRLTAAVARDNLLVKVPATPAGFRAFARLVAQGYKINVTLIFSLSHYRAVALAYMAGLTRWIASGGDPRRVKSVASLFISRTDTLVDGRLDAIGTPEALALRGHTGVALAKLAYGEYQQRFHGPEFAELAHRGARPQYLLWGSTGTKNPAYSDVLYLEPLIGPETVNTLPDATLAAFRDHGHAAATLQAGLAEAQNHVDRIAALGIDLDAMGEELQRDGVRLFVEAYDQLLTLVG